MFHTTRNIRTIDRQAFKADSPPWSLTLDQPTADQLNDQLHALLDRHGPATQRKVPQRRSSPWYSAVASQLRALKRKKRRAERQWLRSGLTVHRQIFNDLKHRITSSKITVSTTCKVLAYVSLIVGLSTGLCLVAITVEGLGRPTGLRVTNKHAPMSVQSKHAPAMGSCGRRN